MIILDIFSWLPEKELSLQAIESIVLELKDGKKRSDGFELKMEIPTDANENIIEVTKDLIGDGRKVCYLLRAGIVIAVLGYKDRT